jgi:Ni/Fe-hydrogenase 1 B-type cytochrome subunit
MSTTTVGEQQQAAEPVVARAAQAHDSVHDAARVAVYVWQAPVRITHWVTVSCIVILSITGAYIADPFLIPPGGSVMTDVRLIHMATAFVFLASGLVRTIWLLVGNRFSRWDAFIPTNRNQATELFRQAGYYAFVRKDIPKVLGHNQLAATAYLALFGLLLVETVTGFTLDGISGAQPAATLFGWLGDLLGTQLVRLIHHLCMWAILAIAIFHIYSCILVDHVERNGLMSSIVSGYKFPTREEVLESRDGGQELLEP